MSWVAAELMGSRAPAPARERLARELERRRHEEKSCAWWSRHEADHVDGCVFAARGEPPCQREYDPMPVPEARPADSLIYEGTGIGALYGGATETISGVHYDGENHVVVRSLLAGTAGWNVRPRKEHLRELARDKTDERKA